MILLRFGTAAALVGTGYIHADLYVHGYRAIAWVGPGFLLLAAACFAVAVLLAAGAPRWMWLGAVGLAVGALAGFVGSRTVGVFGFIERGLQPAPQALLSLVFEAAVLVLCAAHVLVWRRTRPTG